MGNLSPMMQQYFKIKEKYPDCLLFFRLGDFYEMFFEDAVEASRVLELTLTGRDCGLAERAPMCGVPFHSVSGYINKLIDNGYKIAICEQITDPSQSKGLVERDVVRVISAGTVIEEDWLDMGKNNYLLAISKQDDCYGLAWADVSTGQFCIENIVSENALAVLNDYIAAIKPSEILVNHGMYMNSDTLQCLKWSNPPIMTCRPDEYYLYEHAREALNSHFGTDYEEYRVVNNLFYAVSAAGALLNYLIETQKNQLQHISHITYNSINQFMLLDAATRRNLELTEPIRGKGKKGTLVWLLDRTNTAMGKRELRSWVEKPLVNVDRINTRLDAVEEIRNSYDLGQEISMYLKHVYDIERLCAKISYESVNARDCLSLTDSLEKLPEIKSLLTKASAKGLKSVYQRLSLHREVYELLSNAISPEAPVAITDGGIIKKGFNEELDQMRDMAQNSKSWILALEQTEREKTGIKNLKIGYNRVFGYYIEVTKSNIDLVPYNYIRKQTLTNCERYVTEDLKVMEEKLLGVEDRIMKLEYQLFSAIRTRLKAEIFSLQTTANALAELDVYTSFADVARDYQYCKPLLHTGSELVIKEGRHPVVEKMFSDGGFVANDTLLDNTDNRLVIITGPNMAGKSTYMRQVALITLMAHIGCFVPATEAKIALTDRIFTRVGASDDLASGQSTFMVEMNEVANILRCATDKSLIIFDEIGRGTSTFDGLSIAWSVVEYVADKGYLGAKTLFATHYHELSELEGNLDGIKNYSIAVKEVGEEVIFLRKIRRGSADKSFGIQVARLAGLPDTVLKRAKAILSRLEAADINNMSLSESIFEKGSGLQEQEKTQMNMFDTAHPLIEELKSIPLDNLSPIEAMNLLYELKDRAKRM